MSADAVGGVWTYALELTRALEPHNIEILLATMGAPPNEEQREEARKIPNLSVFKSDYKLEWMENPWREVRLAGEWLLELERRLKPDIVHLNGFAHGSLAWHAPKLVVGHSCVLSWWQAVNSENPPAAWNRYKHEVVKGLHAADLVVAPTQAMLDSLEENYGLLPNKRVVPNGRNAELFHGGNKEEIAFSVGRLWDEAKNISTLARVAPNLSWRVYVAGEKTHPDGGVKQQFDNVNLVGRLSPEPLAEWYARAAIYVLPARYEPFGLSVLEAALAGCVLVLGDIPSLREVWQDSALFVPPDDGRMLCEVLTNLMENKNRREELVRKSRARALEFNLRRMAENYLVAYSELLTNAPQTAEINEGFVCTS